jgi:hypothetical protein
MRKEGDIVRVRVLGLGAALAAGYLPGDNGYLKSAKGHSISQAVLTKYAGSVQKGFATGADSYPVLIDGVIFHEGLVSAEAAASKYTGANNAKRELIRFEDGTLAIATDSGYEAVPVEALREAMKETSAPSRGEHK